jgi:GntR family transcriptional regulator
MNLLRRGPTPYYHQISAIIRDKIAYGELRKGDRVPSEEELCKVFKVSRATVRQALAGLEQDGLITREPGRGSFVRCTGEGIAEVKMTCLLDDLIALGIPARNRVESVGVVRASAKVAEALGVPAGDSIFTFQRIVEVDGNPFAANRAFLPIWMKDLLDESDLADPRLLKTLERKCGVQPDLADQEIEAVMADANQANLLHVNAGSALLAVTRSTYDRDKTGIEHSITLYRSDRTRFHIAQRQKKNEADNWVLASRGPLGQREAKRSLLPSRDTRRTRGRRALQES